MTVMSITYKQPVLSVCLLFGSNIKAILNPLLSVNITCPSLSITGIVPAVDSVQQYPSVQQILSFQNDHGCNRTSVGTNTFNSSDLFLTSRLSLIFLSKTRIHNNI